MDLKNSTQKVWSGEYHRNLTANLVVKKERHYYLARLHLQISPNLFPGGSSDHLCASWERHTQPHDQMSPTPKKTTPLLKTLPLDELPLYCLNQSAGDKIDSEETNKQVSFLWLLNGVVEGRTGREQGKRKKGKK